MFCIFRRDSLELNRKSYKGTWRLQERLSNTGNAGLIKGQAALKGGQRTATERECTSFHQPRVIRKSFLSQSLRDDNYDNSHGDEDG